MKYFKTPVEEWIDFAAEVILPWVFDVTGAAPAVLTMYTICSPHPFCELGGKRYPSTNLIALKAFVTGFLNLRPMAEGNWLCIGSKEHQNIHCHYGTTLKNSEPIKRSFKKCTHR